MTSSSTLAEKNLHDLTLLPEHQRDAKWEQQFLRGLPQARLELIHPSAQQGADSWPYLFCRTVAHDSGGEPASRILHWLAERGIGLAINPDKQAPDFVLTYGMLWNYRMTGHFLSEHPIQASSQLEFQKDQKILAGPPIEAYLPGFVRGILRDFLLEQGVLRPRITIVSADRHHYDLCFSLESLGNPPASEHRQLLEAFAWFLPAHYTLAIISEKEIPAFIDL